jgi:adenylate cyclase
LAWALGHLGAVDEARTVWSELRRINPGYSFAEHLARPPYRADADRNRIRDGVKKAGLSH